MYVKQYGNGPQTFLALHGWAGDHRHFAPLAARLPETARLLAPDLPGYGRSPEPSRWTMDAVADEILRALDQRNVRSATWIGFCSGAATALLAARREPARVSRLVLIDPFAYIPWYFRIFLAGRFGRLAYRATFANSFGRKITTSILRRRQPGPDDFLGAFHRVDHEITQRWLALLARFREEELFAELTGPIDLVYGEDTFRAVRKSVRLLGTLWPQARRFELKHIGHLPLVRGAAQLAEILWPDSAICPHGPEICARTCAGQAGFKEGKNPGTET